MKAIVALAMLMLVVEATDALICLNTTCGQTTWVYGPYCGDPRGERIHCFIEVPVVEHCVCDADLTGWMRSSGLQCSKTCGGGIKRVSEERFCNGGLRRLVEGESCTFPLPSLKRWLDPEPCNRSPCPAPRRSCSLQHPFCRG